MTGQKKLSDKLLSYLYGHGLSKSELSQLKSVAPSWIPEQYFQFWKHYTAFSPPSLVFSHLPHTEPMRTPSKGF